MLEPSAHGGKPFRAGICFVALKMENVVASIARTIKEQLKLTPRRKNFAILTLVLDLRSTSCSFSVLSSAFSNISSSRNVGLSIASRFRGAAPGDFIALLRGLRSGSLKPGVGGGRYLVSVSSISTDACEFLKYPNPMSAGCA